MNQFRALTFGHRPIAALLLALALVLRVAVPAGFMPVAGGHGMTVALCDGSDHATRITLPAAKSGAPGAKAASACPYAVLGHALASGDAPPPALAFGRIATPLATPRLVAPAPGPRTHLRPPLRAPPVPA